MTSKKFLEFLFQINGGEFGKLTEPEIVEKSYEIYKGFPRSKISEMITAIDKGFNEITFDVQEKSEIIAFKIGLKKILTEKGNEA
ncbi:MAG: hypothetical protein KKD31_16375 [Bacteroidetes bacterium]|nr:hypothetical protein [Bacteroidota bacterium]